MAKSLCLRQTYSCIHEHDLWSAVEYSKHGCLIQTEVIHYLKLCVVNHKGSCFAFRCYLKYLFCNVPFVIFASVQNVILWEKSNYFLFISINGLPLMQDEKLNKQFFETLSCSLLFRLFYNLVTIMYRTMYVIHK